MYSTGIVRKIDELGRIVLPMELRKTLGWDYKDPLEIYTEKDRVILKKHQPACIFCGNADDIIVYKSKNICNECRKEIEKMPELDTE